MDIILPLAMVVTLLLGILSGYPVALVMGGVSSIFLLISDLPLAFFDMMISRIYSNAIDGWLFIAIPMFVLMGLLLERTGLARDSFKVTEYLFRHIPSHLALTVLLLGSLLAATTGVVGASVILLSVIALPKMLENGYSPSLTAGLISASGTLSILMPPSVMLIVMSNLVSVSVGTLFKAALVPSAMIVIIYAIYVMFSSEINRQVNNTSYPSARGIQEAEHLERGFFQSLLSLAPFMLLIPSVLGTIILGVATPTEASGLGVLAVLSFAILTKKLRLKDMLSASRDTAVASSMIMFLVITATCFSLTFKGVGGDQMIHGLVDMMGGSDWGALILMMLLVFFLGFFLDWLEISLILMPLLSPIVMQLDLGNDLSGTQLMAWFAILVAINLQSSFLTPPFGVSLFYLKGAVGEAISTPHIYRGVVPFIIIQIIVVVLVMMFPNLLAI
ncbi:TRAP transporter large permease subunit [Halomonas sp. McH1-25]|uniref:TRAP transporter large permease n=1 Tax=unclassified Halomonas TaxID=2609666 RepID=UPI001EF4BDDE|nr:MULTISPECIES: TRAP transporter large permease subunit [unclassified Halomonas]MCG7602236.1 TRAP transporter large permease subunit [Halomonas sp. McH1-25]MCP1344591.1 TRAP transporter large permease subunit [Halomonas sp. FL8]MCP1362865.1 TRAP transporter large permease subunit [Halomonas sp. BBD45]MCP1363741.1 TRAP transporter large permease subunit [Halomonas sp. BBD48]